MILNILHNYYVLKGLIIQDNYNKIQSKTKLPDLAEMLTLSTLCNYWKTGISVVTLARDTLVTYYNGHTPVTLKWIKVTTWGNCFFLTQFPLFLLSSPRARPIFERLTPYFLSILVFGILFTNLFLCVIFLILSCKHTEWQVANFKAATSRLDWHLGMEGAFQALSLTCIGRWRLPLGVGMPLGTARASVAAKPSLCVIVCGCATFSLEISLV